MSEHQHLLAKDPRRLGWKCRTSGCDFFKPAEEFDGVRIVCSCTHLEAEHRTDGPCRGLDSYGLPCECTSVEVDRHWSGLSMDAVDE